MSQLLAVLFGALACIFAIIFALQSSALLGSSNESRIATILSITALITTLANSYLSFFWRYENLRIYLSFKDPLQVGSEKLDLTYFFANLGNRSILIEDVGILEFSRNARSLYDPSPELNTCATPYLYGQILVHRLAPPQFRDAGMNMQDGSFLMIYKPARMYIDGSEAVFPSAAIETGKARSIAATFNTTPTDWDRYNTVVICPFMHFFDSNGQPFTSICKGWVTTNETALMGGGMMGGPAPGAPPARLLPISETGICTTTPSAAQIE